MTRSSVVFAAAALGAAFLCSTPVQAQKETKTLRFSGYDWEVRQQEKSGPGPNAWSRKNVWLDKNGNLHLKISRTKTAQGEAWQCAEITSVKKFGMGTYEFQTVGRLDKLNHNIVLGFFDYPVYGEDPDGTNEIDIEFARWGNAAYPNGNFTVYPATGARGKKDSYSFEYALPQNTPVNVVTTHRFTRRPNEITFVVQTGTGKTNGDLVKWGYAPPEKRLVPQKPLAVHVNLWLFGGKAPTDNKEVEIVVKSFLFTPAP